MLGNQLSNALNSVSEAMTKSVCYRPLNALITETFDLAKEQFEKNVQKCINPFTMIVKDCFAIKGIKMTCASKMLENYVAPYTATCVQRLINNGGCLIGKANMDEFAMGATSSNSYFGPVKHFSHCHDLDKKISNDDWRIAGGSSGGCGVAVALGMARMALGSDTGGSTRNPAAFNGVFGFKPSYGTLSRYGLVPLANSFDVPSIFANSAEDCRFFYDIMKGKDELDSTSIDPYLEEPNFDKKKFTIGLPKEYKTDFLSDDAKNVWDFAAEKLRAIGFNVKEISIPLTEYSIICYHILAESDISSNMARYDGVRYGYRCEGDSFNDMITNTRTNALNWVVKKRIMAGNFYLLNENREMYFEQAAKVRRLIKNNFDQAFCEVDAILIPTTSHSAPLYSELKKYWNREINDDYFTQPANMAGLPAISIPVSNCSNNFPLGVQIVCNYLNDYKCLYLAELLHSLIK